MLHFRIPIKKQKIIQDSNSKDVFWACRSAIFAWPFFASFVWPSPSSKLPTPDLDHGLLSTGGQLLVVALLSSVRVMWSVFLMRCVVSRPLTERLQFCPIPQSTVAFRTFSSFSGEESGQFLCSSEPRYGTASGRLGLWGKNKNMKACVQGVPNSPSKFVNIASKSL